MSIEPVNGYEEHTPLVVHVIYRLGTGGLENGLVNIINRTPVGRYRHAIICLTEADGFAKRITRPDVEIISMHKGEGHSIRVYWKLWRIFRKLKPQIIHTRNLAAIEAQIPALFIRGARRVHGEHGRDVFDLQGLSRKYNLLRRLLRPLIQHYIAVSKDLEHWLIETLSVPSSRITQIYNGVDPNIFGPEAGHNGRLLPEGFLPRKGLVIGTVGRLAAVKDQLTLVRAFLHLLEGRSQLRERLRLIIAGDGPLREEIQALITEARVEAFVWLAGERDDVAELLRSFNIFVLPSLGEGVSNTILEAMASGLPVIATRVGGNPELVEEGVTGQLVPAADVKAMSEVMGRYIDQPQLIEQQGRAGLQRVNRSFHWDNTVASYLGVYDELLVAN